MATSSKHAASRFGGARARTISWSSVRAVLLSCALGVVPSVCARAQAAGDPEAPSSPAPPPVAPVPASPPAAPPAPETPLGELIDRALRSLAEGADVGPAIEALRARGEAGQAALVERLEARETERRRLQLLLAAVAPSAKAPKASEPWYVAKVRQAHARLERGDPLGAMQVLDAILLLEPELPEKAEVRALGRRAKALMVRQSAVAADLAVERRVVLDDDPVRVRVRLRNVGEEPLRFAGEDATGGVLGVFELEIIDADQFGGLQRTRRRTFVDLGALHVLEPGAAVHRMIPVEVGQPTGATVMRRVRVQGSLRPRALLRGDEPLEGLLPLFPIEVACLPPDLADLADRPLGAVRAALETLDGAAGAARQAAERRLFFAALLVPTEQRAALFAALRPTIERQGPALLTVEAVLSALAEERVSGREACLRFLARAAE